MATIFFVTYSNGLAMQCSNCLSVYSLKLDRSSPLCDRKSLLISSVALAILITFGVGVVLASQQGLGSLEIALVATSGSILLVSWVAGGVSWKFVKRSVETEGTSSDVEFLESSVSSSEQELQYLGEGEPIEIVNTPGWHPHGTNPIEVLEGKPVGSYFFCRKGSPQFDSKFSYSIHLVNGEGEFETIDFYTELTKIDFSSHSLFERRYRFDAYVVGHSDGLVGCMRNEDRFYNVLLHYQDVLKQPVLSNAPKNRLDMRRADEFERQKVLRALQKAACDGKGYCKLRINHRECINGLVNDFRQEGFVVGVPSGDKIELSGFGEHATVPKNASEYFRGVHQYTLKRAAKLELEKQKAEHQEVEVLLCTISNALRNSEETYFYQRFKISCIDLADRVAKALGSHVERDYDWEDSQAYVVVSLYIQQSREELLNAIERF